MLKVYLPNEWSNPLLFNHAHSLMLDCEQDAIEYTNDISTADLIILLPRHTELEIAAQYEYLIQNGYRNQFIAMLSLFHISEHQATWGIISNVIRYDNPYTAFVNYVGEDKLLLVHHDNKKRDLANLIYYDILWARTKLYFTEYKNCDMTNRVWTHNTTEEMFALSPIKKTTTPKHFLSPMRTYEHKPSAAITPRVKYREKLRTVLDSNKGYVSDHINGVFIKPQQDSVDIMSTLTDPKSVYGGGTWYPVHNDYYNDTIVSIYGETITTGTQVASLTEKTFEPLIKGNFVLPYGYKGMINDIKSYGFLLPEWIDYSYDDYDDDTRWDKYLESVLAYQNMPIEEVIELATKDEHILHHNRSVFYTRPRQNLVELLENEIARRSA